MENDTSTAIQTPEASDDKANPIQEVVTPEAEQQTEQDAQAEGEEKKEKTPEERELTKLRRGLDRQTKQKYEARARVEALEIELNRIRGLQSPGEHGSVGTAASDGEPLSLTRAQLQEMVKSEAEKLAPTLSQQQAEQDRRARVVKSLETSLGKERFDEVAADLDEAFDGFVDRSGTPKPIFDAIFEADDPVKLAVYLANPDNLDTAERLSKLSPIQLGREIAKLEIKIATDKPKPSKAPSPLQPAKGDGNINTAPDPVKNPKEWRNWRNAQEHKKGLL